MRSYKQTNNGSRSIAPDTADLTEYDLDSGTGIALASLRMPDGKMEPMNVQAILANAYVGREKPVQALS